MAALTYFPRPSTLTADGNFALLATADPGAEATTTTGWTVGTTAATAYDEMDTGTEATGGFGAGALPDTTLVTGATSDSFRTESPLNGTFDNANWTLNWRVIAVTLGGSQDGRLRARVFKSANADGSGATELTAATLTGATITNLTTASTASNMTWTTPGSFTFTNEYLFISLAWEITGAGGMSTCDVLLREGGANCVITTANFTEVTAAETGMPYVGGGHYGGEGYN